MLSAHPHDESPVERPGKEEVPMLRNRLAALAVGLSLSASVALGSGASATSEMDRFCWRYGDFGMTHGACASFVQGAATNAAILASVCQRAEIRATLGVTTSGECIRLFLQLPSHGS